MENNNLIPENEPGFDNNGKIFTTMSPVVAAFAAVIGIFLLYQFGGAILTLLIFGFDIEKADVNAMRLLTIAGQILLMLLPTLLIARAVYQENISFALRVRFPKWKEVGIFTIGFIILLPLLQNFLYLQNYVIKLFAESSGTVKKVVEMLDSMDAIVEKSYLQLLTVNSVFEGLFVIILVAVTPAICEEALFRGFVQKSFEQKYKPIYSILITSAFFGIYHFSPYGTIALIALGIYFGYAAYKSDSIFVSMVLHFLNNFFAVIAFIIIGDEELISAKATLDGGIAAPLVSLIVLSIVFIVFIFWVNRNYHSFINKGGENDLSKL
jgi:hypothetical protein